jgi:hypothetical protein
MVTPDQLAIILGLKKDTLTKWRSRRIGPPFVIVAHNTIRYRTADANAFIEARVASGTHRPEIETPEAPATSPRRQRPEESEARKVRQKPTKHGTAKAPKRRKVTR